MSVHTRLRRMFWVVALAAGGCRCPELFAQANEATAGDPGGTDHAAFVVRSWSVEDGLPHNSVNAILQTRDGYLWLATSDGLARFDGVRFTVFGLPEGLPSLRVLALLEDRNAALWIGTSRGLCRLQDGKFESWTTKESLAGDEVTSLAEDSEGALWIGTVTGLSQWHDGRLRTFGKPDGLNDRRVRDLAANPNGGIWVSMFYEGLFRWDGRRFTAVPRQAGISPAPPGCLLQDRRGNLWAGLAGGIVLCRTGERWRQYGREQGLPPNIILRLIESREGAICAAAGNGGLYQLRGPESASRWEKVPDVREGAVALLEDQERNLWVGTRAAGLARLKPKRITTIPIFRGETEAVPRTLAETPDGTIWIGTSSRGLFRMRDAKPESVLRESPMRGYPYVSAVLAARDGSVWWGAGPALFQAKDGRMLSAYSAEYKSWLREDRIRVLCEDRGGGIWVGTQNGQLRLLRDGRFIAFTNVQPAAPVTALVQQADGTLLTGTYGKGLLRVRSGQCTPLPDWTMPQGKFVVALYQETNGVLWVGTEGAGLVRCKDGKAVALTTENGLINNTIVQILEDNEGYLWLGSYRGILRIRKQELGEFADGNTSFVHPLILNQSDGLPSEQCMRGFNAGLRTGAGLLHFSTTRGIVVVDPAQGWSGASAPAVWLEQMLVDGAVAYARIQPPGGASGPTDLTGGPPPKPQLCLPPGKRRLEFQYTGLSLGAPETVRFRYWLEGFDDHWNEAGRQRSAAYSLLPTGRYRFRVTAADNSGLWNPREAGLSFEVAPFFWQTAWFRLGMLAALVAGVVALVRYVSFRRLRLRLRRLEQEAAVQGERARIAKDLHDDLGAHLSQIALLSELAQADFDQPKQARQHIDLIFRTARSVTRSLDEIVWAVNPRNDRLDRFAAHLCTFAPEFLRAAGISCRLDVPMELPATPLPAGVRHHLYLAFKEALHNVVKHAGATEVRLRLEPGPPELTLVIEDNGRGIRAGAGAAPGEDGLVNLRQRMADIGGRFEQQSEPSRGTRTVLVAPLAPEAT